MLYRTLGFNTGVQFIGYYAAILGLPTMLGIFGL
jgi:putative tricarboxylic transport membrane protein